MKKNTLTLLLSLLLGLLILTYVISNAGWNDIIRAFELLSFYKYLFLFGFYFLIYLITLARWGIILNSIGRHVPFAKLLSIRLSEWAVGYITPFSRLGGELVMAYLFKKECNLRYRKGLSVIVVNKIMDFASALIFAVIGIILFAVMYSRLLPKKISWTYILVILFFSLLIYLFYFKMSRKEGFFSMLIKPFGKIFPDSIRKGTLIIEKELHDFLKDKKRIIAAFSISIIINLLTLANLKILGLFLGMNLSLIQLLMIYAFIVFSYFIPIPGSLGSFEGSLALIFALLGYGAGIGVVFALIIRSFELILTGLGLLFVSYYGIKLKGLNLMKLNQ